MSPAGAVARPAGGRGRGGRHRRRANSEQVRALHGNGASVAQIARTVGIARMTVHKYLREGPPQRKRHTMHGQQCVLAPYEPYLLARWEAGCHTATVLWREIQELGFAHSLTTVQRFVNQLRREGPAPPGRPRTALTKPLGLLPRQVAALSSCGGPNDGPPNSGPTRRTCAPRTPRSPPRSPWLPTSW